MRMDLMLNGERLLSLFLQRSDDGWTHHLRANSDFEPFELQDHVAEYFERELPETIGADELDQVLAMAMTGALTSSEEFDLIEGTKDVRFHRVDDA